MNFYKHHIGDYAKKTVHLSLLEHGAYLLMLHAYYGTEKPLPVEALYRITHAHTKAERAAVDSVAAQFWKKTDAGLVNGRAFEELEIAVVQVSAARENGKRGGRPKITQRVSENNPVSSESETQRVLKNKAIHYPLSTIQKEGEPPAPTETAKAKGKIPIPEDLQLTEAMRAQALERFPDADPDEMFTQFRAYHKREGTVYKSWPHAWVTWLGNASKFGYAKRKSSEPQWSRTL